MAVPVQRVPDPGVVVASHLSGEGHFRSRKHRVIGVECVTDTDYWQGLADVWGSGLTVVNVEHDIEATDRHVDELLACPHPLCSWAYSCHWITTGMWDGVIAAGEGARDEAKHPNAYYLQGGEEWARWSAIGLVKITPDAMTGPLRREPWNRLELAVEDAVQGPWHVHWPQVPHHHW